MFLIFIKAGEIMRIKKIMIYAVIAVMALFAMGASAQCGEAKNPLEGVHYQFWFGGSCAPETCAPSAEPTPEPSAEPTVEPTVEPAADPTVAPMPAPTATPTTAPAPAPAAKSAGEPDGDYAAQVVAQVNAERARYGLSALQVDADLTSAARLRAQELTQTFSHTRPDGSSWSSVSAKAYGENIARGQSTPDKVMAAWLSSQGHRENILRSSFGSIGVCAYRLNGVLYWVQLFGK